MTPWIPTISGYEQITLMFIPIYSPLSINQNGSEAYDAAEYRSLNFKRKFNIKF
jgi:hypothetical protein